MWVVILCCFFCGDFAAYFLFFVAQTRFDMVVALTVLMLVALMCLLPLRVTANFRLDVSSKKFFVRAKLFRIPVLREEMYLSGSRLICRGNVQTEINLLSLDGDQGKNIVKAFAFDRLNIFFALDFSRKSPLVMPVVEISAFLGGTLSRLLSHCRVRVCTGFSPLNSVLGEVAVSVSLADILIVLAKQSLQNSRKKRTSS